MKITVVEFSPSGGLYQFALQLADAYAAQGHDVELVTGPDPELAPREPGVRLLPLLSTWHPTPATAEPAWRRKPRRALRALSLVLAWVQLARHIRGSRPDVVQLAEWRFALDGWFVRLLAHRPQGPVFADVAHTPRPFQEQRRQGALYKGSPVLRHSLDAAYRAMRVVFVLGAGARQDLLDAFPDAGPVLVIPHGDEGIYAVEGAASADATPPRVLFFGALARYKGLDLLLDAWPQVRRACPEAQLVIAGSVADVDLPALQARAAAAGGVELRAGYVATDEVGPLVVSSRMVVAPYTVANQSGVVHLAQTLARPAVATDVGDLRVAVRDGETGLLVPPADPDALATALVRLLLEPAEAARLGDAGRRRVEAESSWRAVADKVLPVYARLVAERRSTS